MKALSEFTYFRQDVKRMLGSHSIRILYVWLSRSFAGIWLYRTERSLYLIFGDAYKYIRIPFLPFINLLQAYSNIEINYRAQIAGGLVVLHPGMGVVLTGKAIIGRNLTLTGGNVIGMKKKYAEGDFIIGDYCSLGANAVIIGPVRIANNIKIGASSCVVSSFSDDGIVLMGVPAKEKEPYK